MHALYLLLLYLAIALAPLALAAAQGRPPRTFWDEVASGLAMTGFAILLVEFVLSGRFRTISARIGMDVTMRFHQLIARAALAFIILHPFLYRTPFGASLPWDTTRQLTLGLDMASLASGVIAWVALPIFVLISVFRDQVPYRYETWRVMHAFGAVLIAGMVTHHTLVAGRYSADPLLAGFWILLLAMALASLLWTYVIAPLGEAGKPYEVSSVKKIALKTWEVSIRPKSGDALDFDAGQFVWLNIGHGPFSVHENPFSISSAPGQRPDIRFVIKEVGDLTRRIRDVAPGTNAYVDGAHGNLTLKARRGEGIALIAGGVGIAPLLSIARQLKIQDDPRPLILLYGNRVSDQIVYKEELDQMACKPNTQVIHVISEPKRGWKGLRGQLGNVAIKEVFSFDGADRWLYLVCGPPPMLDAVEDTLMELGIPSGQIISEQFYYD